MIVFPFGQQVTFNKTIILPIINLQWLSYLLQSIWSIRKSNYKQLKDRWLIVLVGSMLLVWISLSVLPFSYFVSGSILFSILFYAILIYLLSNKKLTQKIFQKKRQAKLSNSLDEGQLTMNALHDLLQQESLYTNPQLKIADVADRLNISLHELSAIINTHLQMNFNEFINQYRVEEAKRQLQSDSNFTIEAIGQQSGFRSKSAFYKAFKKHCGTTPAQYKRSY